MVANYSEGGKIYLGKSSLSISTEKFKGSMHEFRIWNNALDLATIAERMNKQLSGKEFNLVGCWQMNEVNGNLTQDIARHRNGIINGAEWVVEPSGRSQNFDGTDDNIEINSGTYAFTNEMDFTIEFWFKSGMPTDTVTFFSNGRADSQANNPSSWTIFGTTDKQIKVMNNNIVFDAATTDYFDDEWHHFALVVNRIGNTFSYVDGNLQYSTTSENWLGLGGAKFWIASRGWFEGMTQHNDNYLNGNIDEVRIWNLARKQEQISRDRLNRLAGTEYGLIAYYPFEKYVDVMGVLTLSETLENIVDNTIPVINGSPVFSIDVPTVKLERPVQNVPFSYSVNGDKIIFTPVIEPYRIENITLDITTKDVNDLQGNVMASPKTWIAYIDKNQVTWEEQELNFITEVNQPLSFQTKVLNTGGELKTFNIENLPNWLTVDNATGSILPNNFVTLNFEINPAVNIGSYEDAIYVTTDFGYNEALILNLHVYATAPNWEVNPDDYEYSMSVFGQLKINDVISIDTADILAAFVGDECRGVAKLQYLETYDMYEAFLDVYSNIDNENIDFKIWDASEGYIHINVEPSLIFTYNNIVGTPSSPQMFTSVNSYNFATELSKGWTWMSFNLENSLLSDINSVLSDIDASTNDQVKTNGLFANFNEANNSWTGNGLDGFSNLSMYMFKLAKADTLKYWGSKLTPSEIEIPIETGWNWISYSPNSNMTVDDAFGNYNPAHNDILKSQYAFAMYDQNMGWLGSLTYMVPGQGYMYNTTNNGDFLIYPASGINKSTPQTGKGYAKVTVPNWELIPENYQFSNSIIAELIIDEVTENHVIGAFVGTECRGIG